jgi:hypothetical protein
MKRHPASLRAFLQDPGGHSDTYALLLWVVMLISVAVGIQFQDEIHATLADATRAILGLLGGWQ